jgi:quinolinate synthase
VFILDFVLSSPADTILVATEPHIIHQMQKDAPDKKCRSSECSKWPGGR